VSFHSLLPLFSSTPHSSRIIALLANLASSFSQTVAVEFVSVKDIALLHVGALLLPNISQKRLIGSAHAASWSQILDIFKKHFPQKDFYPNPEQSENGNTEGGKGKESNYDTKESLRVLNEMGQESWKGLEEIVLESVKPFA